MVLDVSSRLLEEDLSDSIWKFSCLILSNQNTATKEMGGWFLINIACLGVFQIVAAVDLEGDRNLTSLSAERKHTG